MSETLKANDPGTHPQTQTSEANLSQALNDALPSLSPFPSQKISAQNGPNDICTSWLGISSAEFQVAAKLNPTLYHLSQTGRYPGTFTFIASILMKISTLQIAITNYTHASHFDSDFQNGILRQAENMLANVFLRPLYYEAVVYFFNGGLSRFGAGMLQWMYKCGSGGDAAVGEFERRVKWADQVYRANKLPKDCFNGEGVLLDFLTASRALVVFKKKLRGLRRGLVDVESK